ncbi:hypothetical protein AVEN_59549-1 [Araneus ventricosus]|uniref:Uncharacterized protein n=1 Tax=Araneus ventricosus TaxID=182803 RepID=A0A4Y2TU88_ARAVE|nr:hypothetical protein AVEN_59549-1 [Araneus ventricosus]
MKHLCAGLSNVLSAFTEKLSSPTLLLIPVLSMWSVRFLLLYCHFSLLFVAHRAGLCFEVIWLMSDELMDKGDSEDGRMGICGSDLKVREKKEIEKEKE